MTHACTSINTGNECPSGAPEAVTAWQCIGCGRIEKPEPCIGVCKDRKVEFVYAADHRQTLAQLALAHRQRDALLTLVRQLACTTPREDEWERTYRALQGRARGILERLSQT